MVRFFGTAGLSTPEPVPLRGESTDAPFGR